MPSLPLASKSLTNSALADDSLRIIVFGIADYIFGIPIGAVLRVMPCPATLSMTEQGVGMVDLGSHNVTVIDLSQQFLRSAWRDRSLLPSETPTAATPRLLLLTQTRTGELCGILVDRPPSMLDLPIKLIRPISASYQEVIRLKAITHMAVLPEDAGSDDDGTSGAEQRLFLIGIGQVLTERFGSGDRGMTAHPLLATTAPAAAASTKSMAQPRQRLLRLEVSVAPKKVLQMLLPVGVVAEVLTIATQAIVPTPALASWIVGIYNWQGQGLRLIDVANLLGYPDLQTRQGDTANPSVVVVNLQGQLFGLLVATTHDVQWYDLQALQPLPANVNLAAIATYVEGVLPQNRLLLALPFIAQALRQQTQSLAQSLQWQQPRPAVPLQPLGTR
ncbi:MAG: chemotaxis protein CheW [Cyanobacteria bacterium P01_H01_bin.121]